MKKVCSASAAVIMIILLLSVSCQLPGDKIDEIGEKQYTTESTDETESDGNTDPIDADAEQPDSDLVTPEGNQSTPDDNPVIIEEVSMETYKDFSEYHYPTQLAGRTVETENGQRYTLGEGITLPTNHKLYPNPVTPGMFNTAKDGTTSESVIDDGEVFTYELSMSGKFEYKGNEYSGEVVVIVENTTDGLLVNNMPATFID